MAEEAGVDFAEFRAGRRKVLISTPSLNVNKNVSGVSSVVRNIIRFFAREENSANFLLVPIVIGKPDSQKRGFGWLLAQAFVVPRFAIALIQVRPDIVHINGPLSAFAIIRDFFIAIVAWVSRRRIVYHIHGGEFLYEAPKSKILRMLINWLMRLSSEVIVLGSGESQSICERYAAGRDKINVLSNAVDIPDGRISRSANGVLRILSIGRLSPEKGLDLLCAACENDDGIGRISELRMYGDGPQREEVVGSLQASLGDSYKYGGVIDGQDKERAYQWADVVVMPSLREGMPMVLLEAMAFGVVPIATGVGSIPDVLHDCETGLLLKREDSASIATALRMASEMKAEGRLRELSGNAHRLIADFYSLDKYGHALINIYERSIE